MTKIIAVLLLGVMMFGTIQPVSAETVGYYVGEVVGVTCDLFAGSIASFLYGDSSMDYLIDGNSNEIGEAVGTA